MGVHTEQNRNIAQQPCWKLTSGRFWAPPPRLFPPTTWKMSRKAESRSRARRGQRAAETRPTQTHSDTTTPSKQMAVWNKSYLLKTSKQTHIFILHSPLLLPLACVSSVDDVFVYVLGATHRGVIIDDIHAEELELCWCSVFTLREKNW